MATTVVELSGDEAKLLRSLERVIQKEVEHEKKLLELAAQGGKTGDDLAAGFEKVRAANDKVLKGLLGDLGRVGPGGKEAADQLRGYFASTGQAGQKSVGDILATLKELDPAAASVADAIAAQLAEADRQTKFDAVLASMGELGDHGKTVADKIAREMRASILDTAIGFESLVGDLEKLDPAAADVARRIKEEMAESDRQNQFTETLAAMRRLGGEAERMAAGIQTELKQADEGANFDVYLAKLRELDPASAEIAERVRTNLTEADRQSAFDQTLAAMRKLGGEAVIIADGVKSKLASADEGLSLERYLSRLEELEPAAAAAAAGIRAELEAADKQTDFERTLKSLGLLGPEANKVAKAIREDLEAAAAAAAGDMDQILDKLAAIDPTVTASAERVKAELAEAARFSEGKFESTLTTLRAMGPIGRDVAKQLKEHLVGAGELAERSIEDVIAEIERIDPAAADAARKIHANLDDSAKKGASSFKEFGESSIAQIGAVAGAYVGVEEAIQSVNDFLKTQEQLLQNALSKQLDLAKAQQEASKNLAAFTALERDDLLQKKVFEIADTTKFSDIAQITLALGTAKSSGAATSEEVVEAVTAAARVERLTPENLADTAAGAVTVKQQTGLPDIRQAVALIQTAGTEAKITDSSQVIENLPIALNAVSTVRNQEPEEASRQAAAFFAQVTQGGVDAQGSSSGTLSMDFFSRMGQFFNGFEDELVKARSKIELIDRKIAKGSDTELDRLNKQRLEAFVAEGQVVQQTGKGTDAFETLFGRIETLQKNEAVKSQFVGEGFGEKRFTVFVNEVLDAQSDYARNLKSSFEAIQANTEYFEKQAATQASGTSQLRIANAVASASAGKSIQESADSEAATLGAIRNMTVEALDDTSVGGVRGFLNTLSQTFVGRGSLEGTTAAEEGVSAIKMLQDQRRSLTADGLDASEELKVKNIDAKIQAIEGLITQQATGGSLSLESIESAATSARSGARFQALLETSTTATPEQLEERRQNREVFERIANLLEQQIEETRQVKEAQQTTAQNTKPAAPSGSRDLGRQVALANARNAAP